MVKSVVRKRRAKPAPTAFALRLAKTREARGLSRSELAVRAGITESLLCRLETYTRGATAAETIFRLANALTVRPEWLWHGIEPREISPAEKRLSDLRKQLERVNDEQLEEAIRRSKVRYHAGIIAVANTFARDGERHTSDGWIARLDEIAEKLSPLLPN